MSKEAKTMMIDAGHRNDLGHPLDYRELNRQIREAICAGEERLVLMNVMGQRYIASATSNPNMRIEIHGTPGNDLGAFLNGGTIEVFGNAQDVTANTMNDGRIIVHGNSGDITGLAARGGILLVKGNSGYRVGIHIKEFEGVGVNLVIGGFVNDYLGEYMAGGTILVLGQGVEGSPVGLHVGAGMHGGRIYVRGLVEKHQLGTGACLAEMTEKDHQVVESLTDQYEKAFGIEIDRSVGYSKVIPLDSRPFRGHYDSTTI